MSRTIVVVTPDEPEVFAWCAAHDQPVDRIRGSVSRLPTLAEIEAAVGRLGALPVRPTRGGDRWYLDVQFGPVLRSSPGGPPYYGGGGFEVSAQVNESRGTVETLSVRGGEDGDVRRLVEDWVQVCGPLVLVDSSRGVPELVTR